VIRRWIWIAGLAVVALSMVLVDLPARDALVLAALAGGAALAAGAAGAVALHVLRHRSFAAQVSVVALTSTAAVTLGALAAGSAMFVSAHDLRALSLIVVVAAIVGLLAAIALADRVAEAGRALGETARRIADPSAPRTAPPSISEFRRLAAELEDTAARLDRARAREQATEQARRELVAWVSHDLRTPLAGIRAITEALEDGIVDDPPTVARYLATLRTEADRLAGLVDDLFELSRINAGALRLVTEEVGLGDLVSDALAVAGPVADAKGVRLGGRMNGPPGLTVRAAAPELSRVFGNLLDNAIRATPAGGTVSLEAGQADGHVFVAVADTCGGIPGDDLARVFDKGLGLAIARGLVEAHDGDLTVENCGGGCRFVVRLPAPARPA
jgi:signal transduction histidine kinase